jgi:hypothetical protein
MKYRAGRRLFPTLKGALKYANHIFKTRNIIIAIEAIATFDEVKRFVAYKRITPSPCASNGG